jgi:hypothetical protein
MNELDKLSLFVDGAGRYILGVIEYISEDGKRMHVKNPAIIAVNTGPNGQVQIQTIPYFFKELLAPNVEKTVWDFNLKSCTICTRGDISDALKAQYNSVIASMTQPPQNNAPKTVKLFDE